MWRVTIYLKRGIWVESPLKIILWVHSPIFISVCLGVHKGLKWNELIIKEWKRKEKRGM